LEEANIERKNVSSQLAAHQILTARIEGFSDCGQTPPSLLGPGSLDIPRYITERKKYIFP